MIEYFSPHRLPAVYPSRSIPGPRRRCPPRFPRTSGSHCRRAHHAGLGVLRPTDAQHIFDELWAGAPCKPLKIDVTFYCYKCAGMATGKTCPHDPKHHLSVSGTRQREMLSHGEEIPTEFSRPEVIAILREYYRSLQTA